MSKTPSFIVAIVGATGAVGQELLRLLHERQFPISQLRLFASRPVGFGKVVSYEGRNLHGGGGETRRLWRHRCGLFCRRRPRDPSVGAGCGQSGMSGDRWQEFGFPDGTRRSRLVIPEINPEALRTHRGIIANPNCSTAVTLMGLWPLHQRFG